MLLRNFPHLTGTLVVGEGGVQTSLRLLLLQLRRSRRNGLCSRTQTRPNLNHIHKKTRKVPSLPGVLVAVEVDKLNDIASTSSCGGGGGGGGGGGEGGGGGGKGGGAIKVHQDH